MLDWVIIGGGIHGTYLANFLTTVLGYRFDRVIVLDPHEEPCQLWKEVTRNTGMTFLRSPLGHHIGLDADSLARYAKTPAVLPWAMTLGISQRPALALFNSHLDFLARQFGLRRMFRKGRAHAIKEIPQGLSVESENGSFETKNVIIAVGQSEAPVIPQWAAALKKSGDSIKHIFEPTFKIEDYKSGSKVAIVGGGITAAHIAAHLGAKGVLVSLVCKAPIPTHALDFDPCWLSSMCMDGFADLENPDERREAIDRARHKGTAPQDVQDKLVSAVQRGQVRQFYAVVDGAFWRNGSIRLSLNNDSAVVADKIILATGVEKTRPGGPWIDHMAHNLGLPVHAGGYPLVDPLLRWGHPRIFVSGALAELELGPAARNIIGAKLAAERILRLHSL